MYVTEVLEVEFLFEFFCWSIKLLKRFQKTELINEESWILIYIFFGLAALRSYYKSSHWATLPFYSHNTLPALMSLLSFPSFGSRTITDSLCDGGLEPDSHIQSVRKKSTRCSLLKKKELSVYKKDLLASTFVGLNHENPIACTRPPSCSCTTPRQLMIDN